jgi:hypothetical protein
VVYKTQNYWVYGLCPSSKIVNTRKMYQILDQFLSSGEGMETLTVLGPLENSSLSHWTLGSLRNS